MNADDIARQLNESQPINITPQGEIIKLEDTTEGASGPVDRNSGQPVTQLKPQRWYSWFSSNPRRLVDEKEAMQARFPSFQLHQLAAGMSWVGWLRPQKTSTSYKISV